MKNALLLLCTLLLIPIMVYSQEEWIRELDFSGPFPTNLSCSHTSKVYQLSDGGYLSLTDKKLRSISKTGTENWSYPLLRGVELQFVTGGYKILDGLSIHFLNPQGEKIKTINLQVPDTSKGPINTEDMEITGDGGYLIIGNTNTADAFLYQEDLPSLNRQEGLIAKYDETGKLLNYNFFSITDITNIFLRHLLPANDGGYVIWGAITANTNSPDSAATLMIKITETATVTWFKQSSVWLKDIFYWNGFLILIDIRKTYDDAYLAVAGTMVTKLDNSGNSIWQVTTNEHYGSLTVNKDLSFVLLSNDDRGNTYISKYKNTLNNKVWRKIFPPSSYERRQYSPMHVIRTQDGGYIVAGQMPPINYGKLEVKNQRDILDFKHFQVAFLAKFPENGDLYINHIEGRVYKDSLKNCNFESGDIPIQRVLVSAVSGGRQFFSYSDSLGYYSLKVDTGNYTVTSTYTSLYASLICPASPNSYNVIFLYHKGAAILGKDFAYTHNNTTSDLTIYLSGGSFSPGHNGAYYISYHNSGTQVESGSVILAFNSLLTFSSSSPLTPTNSSSGKLTWNYTNLQPGETRNLTIYLSIPLTLHEGDLLNATASIQPIVGDKNPKDNTTNAENKISAFSDANAKFVNPAGVGDAGLIKPNTDLLYTVQFQNTGTDTAFFVQIIDTLDKSLDIATLRLLGSSHVYNVYVKYPNVLTFTYNNITLPGSTTNIAASSGFLQYAIRPHKTAAVGDIITNTAHIYFDYTEAVVTNTTINVISDGTSNIPFAKSNPDLIYPNPASDKVQIDFKAPLKGQISIRSITGRLLMEEQVDGKQALLNVEQLCAGLYFLEVKAEGVYRTSKFIVRH